MYPENLSLIIIMLSFSKFTSSESIEETKNIYVIKSNRQNPPQNTKADLETLKLYYKNKSEDDSDDIFKQLDLELNGGYTERVKTPEQEKEESDQIFQELILETSTPKSRKKKDKNTETLEIITDSIAKLVLPGKGSPANVVNAISSLLKLQRGLVEGH